MSGRFKILAIDGGGFRGVYAAYILKKIQDEFSVSWGETFDLIVGTSTGAILAAGLVVGVDANEILDLYRLHGKKIFKKRLFRKSGFFCSRYDNDHLKAQLHEVFGDKKLGEISFPLILPATDIGNGGVHVFKSGYDREFVRDKDVLVADAVLASCSAPTFFDPVRVGQYILADGGLWANNPSLVAAIDAKRRLGIDLKDVYILSLGTGIGKKYYVQKSSLLQKLTGWGFLSRWGRGKFIEMLLNLQSITASNMLSLVLQPSQMLRINFEETGDLPLDDPCDFDDLISRADKDFSHNSARIASFLGIGIGPISGKNEAPNV